MSSRREEESRRRRENDPHRSGEYTNTRSSKPSCTTSRPDNKSRRSGERSVDRHSFTQSNTSCSQNHSFKRPISASREHCSSKRSRNEGAETHHLHHKHSKLQKSNSSQKTLRNADKIHTPNNKSPTILPEVTANEPPTTVNACPSADLPLDLEALDKRSEQRLRQERVVHLPDSNTYYFEKQKEQYYTNMYRLIVTARSHIQQLEQQVGLLNKRLDCKSIVTCPGCQHNFSTGPNRYLPKYLKVLRSTNRVELQFNDREHLKNWMIGADLDRDAKGIPCLINQKRDVEKGTLKELGSLLAPGTTEDSKDMSQSNEKNS